MKTVLLPFLAITLAFTGIFYTACGESKAGTLPANTDTKLLRNEMQRMEVTFSTLQNIHGRLVNAHSGLMGELPDSLHLRIEQEHRELLDADKQLVADISLMQQFSQTGDTLETRTKLELIRDGIKRLETDLSRLQADHEAMTEAHKR